MTISNTMTKQEQEDKEARAEYRRKHLTWKIIPLSQEGEEIDCSAVPMEKRTAAIWALSCRIYALNGHPNPSAPMRRDIGKTRHVTYK